MEIIIRNALPSDFEKLADLGRITFYETWRSVNTEEDMQKYMKEAFDPSKIKSDVENKTVNTFLLAQNGNDFIGYTKLRRDRTHEEFKNEMAIEVERIYILKQHQDKKIGKMLMDKSLEIASSENYIWIWLGVNIDNLKAINFYKKYNFEIFGEKNFKLGEAEDVDYLMKRKVVTNK